MILANKNFQFVQNAKNGPHTGDQVKYHVVGRLSTLGTAAVLVATAIAKAVVAIFAGIAFVFTFGLYKQAGLFSLEQFKDSGFTFSAAFNHFISTFALHLLNNPSLVAPPPSSTPPIPSSTPYSSGGAPYTPSTNIPPAGPQPQGSIPLNTAPIVDESESDVEEIESSPQEICYEVAALVQFKSDFQEFFNLVTGPKCPKDKDFSKIILDFLGVAFEYAEYEKASWLLTLLPIDQAQKILDIEKAKALPSSSAFEQIEWLQKWLTHRSPSCEINRNQLNLFALDLGYGYKSSNLMVMQKQLSEIKPKLKKCDIAVPSLEPISHYQNLSFLNKKVPEIFPLWNKFLETFSQTAKSTFVQAPTAALAKQANLLISPEGEKILQEIQLKIKRAYSGPQPFTSPFITKWLKENPSEYLIVRSSGKEDSDTSANAGGNDTIPFVKPEDKEISLAIGKVVSSYFGTKSITQRLQSGDQSLFTEKPFLPCLLQTIIAEPTASDSSKTPVTRSGVLFTQEQGKANVVTINASFGNNEGVVSSQVAVDTYLVSDTACYTTVRNKKTRFKQIKNVKTGKLKVAPVPNPKHAEQMATLTEAMVKDLKTVALNLGKLYGSGEVKPMDMEYTIDATTGKKPKIYLLQIRPLMKPEEISKKPSFLDLASFNDNKKVAEDQKLKLKTFQTGGPYLRAITNPNEQVIIADDLPGALKKYQQSTNVQKIDLIVIKKTAPITSHEAVTLRPTNIPIFIASTPEESDQVEKLLFNAKDTAKVLICPQRGFIAQETPLLETKEGLITYPGQLELSLNPPGFQRSSFSFKNLKVENKKKLQEQLLTNIAKSVKEWTGGAPLDTKQVKNNGRIHELFDHLAMHAEPEAKKALSELFTYLLHFTTNYMKKKGTNAQKGAISDDLFDLLDQSYTLAKSQLLPLLSANSPAETMNRLFHLKQLESLIFQPHQEQLVEAISFATLLQQHSGVEMGTLEFKKLGIANSQENAYLLSLRKSIYSEKTQDQWNQLIKKLNSSQSSLVGPFIQSMKNLQALGLADIWLNTIFPKNYGVAVNHVTLPALPNLKEISSINNLLTEAENDVKNWADPSYADKHMDKHNKRTATLRSQLSSLYSGTTDPFAKQIAIVGLKRLLTASDLTIKEVTGSPDHALNKKSQAKRFVNLVENYLSILETSASWAGHLEHKMTKPSMGAALSFKSYIQKLRVGGSYRFGFTHTFNTQGLNLIKNQIDGMSDSEVKKLFDVHPEFNVAALAIGSKADLNFSAHWPRTLEEAFTTIHQSSEAILDALQTELGLQESALPERAKPLVQLCKDNLASELTISAKEEALEIHFKIPLRQHGASCMISVPKDPKKKMQLSVSAYGNEEQDRWKHIASFAAIFSAKLKLPFASNVPPQIDYKDPKGVSFTFDLPFPSISQNDGKNLIQALRHILKTVTMGGMSGSGRVVSEFQTSQYLNPFSLTTEDNWLDLPVEVYANSLLMNSWAMGIADKKGNHKSLLKIAKGTLLALGNYGSAPTNQNVTCSDLKNFFVPSKMTDQQFIKISDKQTVGHKAFLYLLKAAFADPTLLGEVSLILQTPLIQNKFSKEISNISSFIKTPEEQYQDALNSKAYHLALRLAQAIPSQSKFNAVVKKMNELIVNDAGLFTKMVTNLIASQPDASLIDNWIDATIKTLDSTPKPLFADLLLKAVLQSGHSGITDQIVKILTSDFSLSEAQKNLVAQVKKQKEAKKQEKILLEQIKNYDSKVLNRLVNRLHGSQGSQPLKETLSDLEQTLCHLMTKPDPLQVPVSPGFSSANPMIGKYLGTSKYDYFPSNSFGDTTKLHKVVSFALAALLEAPATRDEALHTLTKTIAFYQKLDQKTYPGATHVLSILFGLTAAYANQVIQEIQVTPNSEQKKAELSSMLLELWDYDVELIRQLFNKTRGLGTQLIPIRPAMRPFPLKLHAQNQIYAGPTPLLLSEQRDEFKEKKIAHAVCFLSEEEVEEMDIKAFYKDKNVKFHSFPIEDFGVPSSVKQTHSFLKTTVEPLFNSGNAYFHCKGGKGRTGTMLACMMAMQNPKLKPGKIIDQTREAIPGAIETPEQEEFIEQFHKYVNTL